MINIKEIESGIKKKLYIRFFILLFITNLFSMFLSLPDEELHAPIKFNQNAFLIMAQVKLMTSPSQGEVISLANKSRSVIIHDIEFVNLIEDKIPSIDGGMELKTNVLLNIPKEKFSQYLKMKGSLFLFPSLKDVTNLRQTIGHSHEINY